MFTATKNDFVILAKDLKELEENVRHWREWCKKSVILRGDTAKQNKCIT